MDVDNENFYDEIASLIPEPGDYSLEDLDEIIRSTDSHLDASLDINAFVNDFDMTIADLNGFGVKSDNNMQQKPASQQQQMLSIENETQINFGNGYNLNFSTFPSPTTSQQSGGYSSPYVTPVRASSPTSIFPSPATSHHSAGFSSPYATPVRPSSPTSAFPSPAASHQSVGYSSPYETPVRTSSPTSVGDEHFNPDDFINFLNDDDIKTDDLTTDTFLKLNENYRNTPSPTGSCTSSSGSSTSGVHSDASSGSSIFKNSKRTMNQEGDDELLEFIKFKTEKSDQEIEINKTSRQKSEQQIDYEPVVVKEEDAVITTASAETTLLPITLPVLPVTAIANVQPINYVQATIIPVQKVPLTTVNPVANIKTPTAIKIDSKTTSNKIIVGQPSKLVTASTSSAKDSTSKVISPPNAKPKTIFLSSNDFKSLMQKMNTNGKKVTGVNGQIPKIIMKTANGKIIAGNKITNSFISNTSAAVESPAAIVNNSLTTATSNSKSLQFVSKMTKASGPMIIKHHPSKVVTSNARAAAVMAAARATMRNGRNDFSILKGLNDDKLLKKQLRMLKNRESASLSRKKKKEYIERLENRISDLEKENYTLKGENSSLRSQLMAFAQTCNCKHGNVSEFILNTLNMDGQGGASVLNGIDASYLIKNAQHHLDNCSRANNDNNVSNTTSPTTHHVKIAPKPANAGQFINKSFKQRMHAPTVKKNVAVLCAMVFMVTWNFGFQNYLNKQTLESAIDTSAAGINEEPVPQTGRRLLWVPTEHEFHEQVNRSKRETEMANMPPPPLHFLRPVNRTTPDKMNDTWTKDEPPIKRATTTATYANATLENMRLARNLHKWIGGNDYLNLTGTGIGKDIEQIENFKFGSGSYMDYNLPLQAPIGTKQKRKIILDSHTQEKHAKLNIEGGRNSLDLFKPRISEEYLKLFRGIKRQDDTFYVLSFNMEHILLPASAYNKSSRPKMSLMLPARDPLNNGDIVLMQIDCEVINTTELEIKSHMIPEKLRPSKFSANVNDVANNETVGPPSATVTKSKGFTIKKEETKEKPSAPRTYFMMGPKNQPASQSVNSNGSGANTFKRKPTIVKLNANDSVIGSGVLNVRNSSLFSRMRETVSTQTNGFVTSTDVKKLI